MVIFSRSNFKLEPVARWSRLEYDINSGYLQQHYNHENNILGNVRHYDSSLYLAVPRWRDGANAQLLRWRAGTRSKQGLLTFKACSHVPIFQKAGLTDNTARKPA